MLNSYPSVRKMMPKPLVWLTAVSYIKAVRNAKNRVGAITQPCFTPMLMLNDPDFYPSYIIHTRSFIHLVAG